MTASPMIVAAELLRATIVKSWHKARTRCMTIAAWTWLTTVAGETLKSFIIYPVLSCRVAPWAISGHSTLAVDQVRNGLPPNLKVNICSPAIGVLPSPFPGLVASSRVTVAHNRIHDVPACFLDRRRESRPKLSPTLCNICHSCCHCAVARA